VDYERALQLQMRVVEFKKQGWKDDVLLLLEHSPTITLGRNGRWAHLLASPELLRSRGVVLHEIDRGGDITFHGPGQLVGYPLLELEAREKDVRRYMNRLEEVLIQVVGEFGIRASREKGRTGVWTEGGKIAALGVHISRWITRHGFALNVDTDLSYFDLIVPCGITGAPVTSMSRLLGAEVDMMRVVETAVSRFGELFGRRMVRESEADLLKRMEGHARQGAVA
jgi:lipoate-protein ligase B